MTLTSGKIAVIGGGAWGTALAQVYANAGRETVLYARDEGLASIINTTHINALYLPDIVLDPRLRATAALDDALDRASFVLIVTPTQYVRDVLVRMKPHMPAHAVLVNCAKGIEISTGKLLADVAAEIIPDTPYAVLSGPTFAHEVARNMPAAVTLATKAEPDMAETWGQALSTRLFRAYTSPDPVGAEVAGALKNVIAIACGIVEGKGLGQNAIAAVMTRGMAEIRRLGLKMGAEAETFLGLCGLGDLTLTCHSMSSRNFSLGAALGRGEKIADLMSGRRTVAEGYTTAKAVHDVAMKMDIEMPICDSVFRILHAGETVDAMIEELLSRNPKPERY